MTDTANPPAMREPLRVILVEDSADDVALLLRALRIAGYVPEHALVQTPDELDRVLRTARWDIVLSDYALPALTGLMALRQVFAFDPDIPFIIVSGNIGEDVAVAAMKAGAHDYLLKDNLTRLGGAIQRELREAGMRRARRRNELELLAAKQRLQALSNRMLEMQETERRHIARELHDEIGQSLTAIKLSLDTLARRLGDDPARHLAGEIAAAAGHVLDQVRQLSLDLRPPSSTTSACAPRCTGWSSATPAKTAPSSNWTRRRRCPVARRRPRPHAFASFRKPSPTRCATPMPPRYASR